MTRWKQLALAGLVALAPAWKALTGGNLGFLSGNESASPPPSVPRNDTTRRPSVTFQ